MTWFQTPSPTARAKFAMAGGQGWLGYDLDSTSYEQAFDYFVNELGYRLVDVWGYCQGNNNSGDALYAGMWEECRKHPAQFSQHAIAFDDFQATFDSQKSQGFSPLRICGYSAGNANMFATIWEHNGTPAWAADHNIDLSDLTDHIQQVQQMGYRITDLNAYMLLQANPTNPGAQIWVPKFSSISVPSDGRSWMVNAPVPLNAFQNFLNQQQSRGWYPVQISGYGGDVCVIGLWEGSKYTTAFGQCCVGVQAFQSFLNTVDGTPSRPKSIGAFNQLVTLDPPPISQYSPNYCALGEMRISTEIVPELAADFLRNNNIPGLSLAVAQQGKLVYADGFGIADKSSGQAVQPTSRFRIASISKAITSAAIFQLVESNHLTLDDLVFGPSGRLATLGTPVDPRVIQITLHELLQHAGGGWDNSSDDPMFTHPELDARALITEVITTRPLDNAPGTAYAYSNFGYCVLGRVIEAVTGQTYEDYVRQNILDGPCGAQSMLIGGNTLAQQQPDEVVYYGISGEDPYGMQVSRMDSHGGWVGTATDYLRFMVRDDGLPTVPDLLSSNDIAVMTTPSGLPNSNGYACGWVTNADNTWFHTGSLPGTRTFMARTADGYCWVALVNSGTTDDTDPTGDTLAGLDTLMWAIRDRVDLFARSDAL